MYQRLWRTTQVPAFLIGGLFSAVALWSAAGLLAAEWPQFRGPRGAGIAADSGVPVEVGPQKNLLWKTPLPEGHSSPVIAGDKIFLTAAENEKLYTFCLDRASGKILWRREAPRPRQEPYNPTNTAASPTPATDGRNVYVFFGDFGLLSYAADGAERWRLPLGPFKNRNGHGASPILEGDTLLLICDQDESSYLLAVEKDSGKVKWKGARPGITRGYATPAVFRPEQGPPQVIAPGAYQAVAHSLETGQRLWSVRGLAWQSKTVPLIDGDVIYIHSWERGGGLNEELPAWSDVLAAHDADGDGRISAAEHPNERLRERGAAWEDYDLNDDGYFDERDWQFYRARRSNVNTFFAVRPGDARGDITNTHVLWRMDRGLPNTSSPILYAGALYMVKDGGILTSVDPKTGDLIAQERLEGAIDKYWASPVATGGRIYLLSENCTLSVIQVDEQEPGRWTPLAANSIGDTCFATPAMVDGRIYLRSKTALYCFGQH